MWKKFQIDNKRIANLDQLQKIDYPHCDGCGYLLRRGKKCNECTKLFCLICIQENPCSHN